MSTNETSQLSVRELALKAKATRVFLREAKEEQRQMAIRAIAAALKAHEAEILAANAKDMAQAEQQGLSSALRDRLRLTPQRLGALGASLSEIAAAPPVLGKMEDRRVRADGLEIMRQRIPLGLIGVIFESRPNVLVDCAALAIKSGNAILLKGGRDAAESNACLGALVQRAIAPFLPEACVQVIPSGDRALTIDMVKLEGILDLVIPRGGEGLIQMVREHARVPVIAHAKGLCHLYLHEDAEYDTARSLVLNAKTQRPAVCNALETLLVHESLLARYLPQLLGDLKAAGVCLRAESRICQALPQLELEEAQEEDWDAEYLDLILSVRLVPDLKAALAHIERYGSHHTEAIVARDSRVIDCFVQSVDASCVAVNASTRFNDGGELGLGAEIGISTSKLHAYGPMGARELTSSRFVVVGQGHCRR